MKDNIPKQKLLFTNGRLILPDQELPQSSLLPKFVRRIDAYGGFHYQASSHFFIVTSPISIKISVPLFV